MIMVLFLDTVICNGIGHFAKNILNEKTEMQQSIKSFLLYR